MTCILCTLKPQFRRGLCTACHSHARRHGTLNQVALPSKKHDPAYVIEEWQWLRSFGIGLDQIAEQLGMTRHALDKAIEKHARSQELVA